MKNRYLKNVATLKINSDLCTGCGRCLEVCPHNVFLLKDKKSVIVDKDQCMECGACVKNCPFDALEVKPGVGCAFAVIMGWLTGTEPSCDCSSGSGGSCC
ncbi:mercury methylation ferredoxin HgcB [Desulfosporosinus youngiae]|uniref:Dissimilatory sulfite reductase (Desulfoviridin), alpha/beta subunit n=1 Tax=Desulfosporosinus youngiae DSM 17734 TaxID=768710 RepID=H5XXI8_9FIRM|nr:mercury methylation ferredoxin HgcB [Desulfosporosinus youngiae]EHQ91194.1 dissimilatory sulfite reductase (desulfoviridin), alpha/beta subunit [Desulfosporosinus youngiae DSM 17734]